MKVEGAWRASEVRTRRISGPSAYNTDAQGQPLSTAPGATACPFKVGQSGLRQLRAPALSTHDSKRGGPATQLERTRPLERPLYTTGIFSCACVLYRLMLEASEKRSSAMDAQQTQPCSFTQGITRMRSRPGKNSHSVRTIVTPVCSSGPCKHVCMLRQRKKTLLCSFFKLRNEFSQGICL